MNKKLRAAFVPGISGKLVGILFAVGIFSLFAVGSYNYYSAIIEADRQLDRDSDSILVRLSVNLPNPVYEFSSKTTAAVVESEFTNEDVVAIIIRNQSDKSTLFEHFRNSFAKNILADSSRFFKKEKMIEFMDGAEKKPVIIGIAELYMDRQKLVERIFDHALCHLAGSISAIIFLLFTLAFIIKKYLVCPLDKIRLAMEESMARIRFKDSPELYEVPFISKTPALVGGFSEIRRIAECFEDMSNAIIERQIELSEGRERISMTLKSIGDAIITTDTSCRINRMNPSAEKLTGLNFLQAVGYKTSEILKIIDVKTRRPVENLMSEVMRTGIVSEIGSDIVMLDNEGGEIYISGTCAPVRNRKEHIIGGVMVFRDVTQSRRIEEQLHQARKMDVIGQLAGGVAHDFNNMLGGILGNAELLSFSLPADSHLKKYVDTIIKGTERAADLTRKLLAFSRKAKIVTTPIDIHEQIRTAISLLERSIDPRIQILTSMKAAYSTVASDPTLLQNAFLNLALNARDAMPDGGTLSFETSNVIFDADYCKNQPYTVTPGMYIEIGISDTGVGMSKEVLSRVFEPFFTTKPVGQGTGLGLSAVYGTVKEHQGSISVYSELGTGTVFRICLPVEIAENSCDNSEIESFSPRGGGCILVVDDELIIRSTARALLVSLGYDVILAADGEEAVKFFLMDKDRISVVLLDIVMPKIGGRDVFHKIREIDPDVPVIFSSGFSNEGIVNELMELGAAAFIQKPYRLSSLAATLQEIIRRR